MARKLKVGIPYFSCDSDFFEDPKIKMLIARYGSDGFTVYMKIITNAYKEHGYFLPADEDTLLILAGELGISYDKFLEIIDFMCAKNLFDNALKRDSNILTSVRMQTQYLLGTERREEIFLKSKYLLVDPVDEKRKTHKAKIYIDDKCITETDEMYSNKAEMYSSGTQSKVKSESKVKYKESKAVAEPQKPTFFNSHFETIKNLYAQHTRISDPNIETHVVPIAKFYEHKPKDLTEAEVTGCIVRAFKALNKAEGVRVDYLRSGIQAKISAKWEEKLDKLKENERKEAEIQRKEREKAQRETEWDEKTKLISKYKTFYEKHSLEFTSREQQEILRLLKENKVIQLGLIIEPKIEQLELKESD